MHLKERPSKKVLILSYMGIGDNIMAIKALRYFSVCDDELIWVIKSESAGFIKEVYKRSVFHSLKKHSSTFSQLFILKELMTIFLRGRKAVFDSAVILDYKAAPGFVFYMFARLLGVKRIIVTGEKRFSFLKPFKFMTEYRNKHEVERYQDMFAVFFKRVNSPAILSPTHYDRNYTGTGKYICVAPGSEREFKKWDIEKYKQLIGLLITREFNVVLIGGKSDSDEGVYLQSCFENGSLINLIGKTSISESANVLRHSELLLSNDSAMMHMADLLNIPVVGLFGITRPQRCGPYSQQTNVVISAHPENGIYYYGKFLKWTSDCINQISVEEVFKKIKSITADVN